jgi:hypothetical protein
MGAIMALFYSPIDYSTDNLRQTIHKINLEANKRHSWKELCNNEEFTKALDYFYENARGCSARNKNGFRCCLYSPHSHQSHEIWNTKITWTGIDGEEGEETDRPCLNCQTKMRLRKTNLSCLMYCVRDVHICPMCHYHITLPPYPDLLNAFEMADKYNDENIPFFLNGKETTYKQEIENDWKKFNK